MEYLEWIIKIGAALTAFTGIVVLIKKIITFFCTMSENISTTIKYVSQHKIDVDKIDEIERHTKENYMMCLRLTIMNSEMPLGERIVAGHRYIEEGGNGEVKQYCENELNIKKVCKN